MHKSIFQIVTFFLKKFILNKKNHKRNTTLLQPSYVYFIGQYVLPLVCDWSTELSLKVSHDPLLKSFRVQSE